MKTFSFIVAFIFLLVIPLSFQAQETDTGVNERRLFVGEYRSKIKAGWIGQMVGVGWGEPTEFRWRGEIIPADKIPEWQPEMVNAYSQDDLYVEMTYLHFFCFVCTLCVNI